MGSVALNGGLAYVTGLPYVSPSRLSTLQGCERRFAYQYVDGKREGGTEATAMGAAFAVGLETHDPNRMMEEYRALRPEDPFMDPDLYKEIGIANEWLLIKAFNGYEDRFGLALTREVTYLTAIEENAYFWGGDGYLQCRVDGIEDGDTALIEDKLRSGTAMRPEALAVEVGMGFQLSAEIWSHEKATGNRLPVHFRCIKKPNPRELRTAIKLDTVGEFLDTHFSMDKTWQTFEVTRTDQQLHDFERDLRSLSRRALHITESTGYRPEESPRNTGHCFSYGRACPFIDRCTASD